MKILYVISSLKRSGPVNVLYEQVSNLAHNHKIYLITLSEEESDSRVDEFLQLPITLIKIPLRGIKFYLYAQKNFIKIVKEVKPDIVHSHGFRGDYLLSKLPRNEKKFQTISTLHNFPFEDYKMEYGNIKGFLFAKAHLFFLRKIDKCIAVSDSIVNKLNEKKYNHLKLLVVNNGVTITSSDFNQRLKKNINDRVYISVGRLILRKNVFTIVDSFEKSLNNDTLYILGDGPERIKLEQNSPKNIKFLGNVDNVPEYLKKSNFFVSASFSEGLPMAAIEAMGYGSVSYTHLTLPTICSV